MRNYLLRWLQKIIHWLQQQYLIKQFAKKHPKLYRWLLARFSTKHFTGIPLLILICLLVLNILVLSELTESIVETEAIVKVDIWFSEWLYKTRSTGLSNFFYGITQLGTREAIIALGFLLTLWLFSKKMWLPVPLFWLCMAGMGLTVIYGKRFIERPRPEDIAHYTETSFSFPSGHAASAMALFGLAAYLVLRYQRRASLKYILILSALFFVIFVGFSRIYLGVHYLSDVLAGYIVGGSWVIVTIVVLELLSLKLKQKNKPEQQF